MTLNPLPGVLLMMAALLSAAATAADTPGALHVDVLVFTQPGTADPGDWQATRPLPPCHAVVLREGAGAEAAFGKDDDCRRVPGHEPATGGYAGAGPSTLATQAGKLRAAGHGVLANQGWRQAGGNLAPVLLRGGTSAGDKPEVDGTISVSASGDRFVEVSLALTLAGANGNAGKFATLHETRRLALGETHYFDHPLFGALVLVSPAK